MSCCRKSTSAPCCPVPRRCPSMPCQMTPRYCAPKPCPPKMFNVSIPKPKVNPYAICVPLYPCDGCCVPVKQCGLYCQPFSTPGSKHVNRCDNEDTRNFKYPETCISLRPTKNDCCWAVLSDEIKLHWMLANCIFRLLIVSGIFKSSVRIEGKEPIAIEKASWWVYFVCSCLQIYSTKLTNFFDIPTFVASTFILVTLSKRNFHQILDKLRKTFIPHLDFNEFTSRPWNSKLIVSIIRVRSLVLP